MYCKKEFADGVFMWESSFPTKISIKRHECNVKAHKPQTVYKAGFNSKSAYR